MSILYRLTTALNDGSTVISNTNNYSDSVSLNIDNAVNTTPAQLIACNFQYAKLSLFFATCDQNMTLKTNNNSAPGNTINLLAGVPMQWAAAPAYFANPFTSNVTALYCTNLGVTSATLTIRTLLDS